MAGHCSFFWAQTYPMSTEWIAIAIALHGDIAGEALDTLLGEAMRQGCGQQTKCEKKSPDHDRASNETVGNAVSSVWKKCSS